MGTLELTAVLLHQRWVGHATCRGPRNTTGRPKHAFGYADVQLLGGYFVNIEVYGGLICRLLRVPFGLIRISTCMGWWLLYGKLNPPIICRFPSMPWDNPQRTLPSRAQALPGNSYWLPSVPTMWHCRIEDNLVFSGCLRCRQRDS